MKRHTYKINKAENLIFSDEAKSYQLNGKNISNETADKIKAQYAKKGFINNAQVDPNYDPIGVKILEALIKNLTPRELVEKNQAIIYHRLKRYIDCFCSFYDFKEKDKVAEYTKARPYTQPKNEAEKDPYVILKAEFDKHKSKNQDKDFLYNDFIFKSEAEIINIFNLTFISSICLSASSDKELEVLSDSTGFALFGSLTDILFTDNNLDLDSYQFLKHLILVVDHYFISEIKANVNVCIVINRKVKSPYYQLHHTQTSN